MSDTSDRAIGLGRAVRTGLAALGPIGRAALLGFALSAAVAVVLGLLVPRFVRNSLLDAEVELLSSVVRSTEATGLVDLLGGNADALEAVESFVQERLLGSRTIRVEIIDPTGRIVFSDFTDLIGERFPLSESATEVLDGLDHAVVFDSDEPENEAEEAGDLIEFIFPVRDEQGGVVGLFEIYQPNEILAEEVAEVRRTVWIAIVSWLGIAAVSTALLTTAAGRQTLRQFRRSEHLLHGLLKAEEAERKRVVGALHNEVGQPLYRILFGLQATRHQLGDDHPSSAELAELEHLARGIDKTLRSEFNVLYRPTSETESLSTLIEQLVARMSQETEALVTTRVGLPSEPGVAQREAIYRAAEEALANVMRHADAGSVSLDLMVEDRRLLLEVVDDGVGAEPGEGIGLLSTRERLEAIGGGLEVLSEPRGGTRVTAWVPWRGEVRE